ncbi:uncharacterized protein LOC141909216 [Tubulanus polymorphus]|uniref:uncharacterized protein LOC141909216 n=1 Tax=Tubulanus polymorphus TaxID=672921 RepID=UPI003DA2CEA5
MTYFPFDSHNVTVEFESWTYSAEELKMVAMYDQVETSLFVASEEWKLVKTYTYETALAIFPYPRWGRFRATFLISRKPAYYVINIVIPLIAFSLLTQMVFLLPPESGEKLSLSVTVLVTCSVFHLLLADLIPRTSNPPIIGIASLTDEERCTEDLMSRPRNVLARPVLNQSDTFELKMMFGLVQIIDVNERMQAITLGSYVGMNWTDRTFKWNASDYGGVNTVHMFLKDVWYPDVVVRLGIPMAISLRNSDESARVVVYSNVIYITFMLMMLILSVILSVCVIRISFRKDYPVPDWLRKFVDVISRKAEDSTTPMTMTHSRNDGRVWMRVAKTLDRLMFIIYLGVTCLVTICCFGALMVLKSWTDRTLTWNASDYGGVKTVHMFLKDIWYPDIVVKLGIPKMISLRDNDESTKVIVYFNGTLFWYPAVRLSMSTPFDMTYFPFDSHNVTVEFESWTYSAEELKMVAMYDRVETSLFVASQEWNLVKTYAYVAEFNIPSYPRLGRFRATFLISRKPAYYVINIVIPLIAFSLLTQMVFLLPPESGEKISLSVTVLVTCSVFHLLLADLIPRTSKPPIIVIYITFMLMMLILSVILSVCVIRISFRNDYPVPDWLRKLVDVIGRNSAAREAQGEVHAAAKDSTAPMTMTHARNDGQAWMRVAKMLDRLMFIIYLGATCLVTACCFIALMVK